jgi:purine catabolism regulator
MVESLPFTLGDLVASSELGLELVVGDARAGSRVVAGAQSSDIEHPTRWLARDWVLLITGVGLSPDVEQQRALIAELDEAGLAALGFAVDVVHREVPPALIAAARERGFPIFTVPLRTAFRDVIGTVYRNVMSQEIRAAHRLAAMQRFLMDAIGEEAPEVTVVERLGALLGAKVGLLREDGEPELGAARLPGKEIVAAIEGHPQVPAPFETGELHGLALPIDLPSQRGLRWLVIATPHGRTLHPLARAAAHVALPLFIAMARLTRVQAEHDLALRRAVLEALIAADDRHSAGVAAARARACGVDVSRGVAVIALSAPERTRDPEELLRAVERTMVDLHVPMLASLRGRTIFGLLTAPVDDQVLLKGVLGAAAGLRVGVGRIVTDPVVVPQSLLDAELAVREPPHRSSPAIVRYDDLDLGTILLNEVSVGRLMPKVEDWLGPLRENPMFYETVVSFLEHNLDVTRTAKSLQLHPNSVRYRLARAEELIGAPLRAPSTIVGLHIAMATGTTAVEARRRAVE